MVFTWYREHGHWWWRQRWRRRKQQVWWHQRAYVNQSIDLSAVRHCVVRALTNALHNRPTEQVQRLHMILKPFMMRRVKKDVENELADKVEVTLPCDLTERQSRYYSGLRNKISVAELLDKSNMTEQMMGRLMNLVMQFRKVRPLVQSISVVVRASEICCRAGLQSPRLVRTARGSITIFVPGSTSSVYLCKPNHTDCAALVIDARYGREPSGKSCTNFACAIDHLIDLCRCMF
jgi:hypothetical protein